MTKNKIFVTGDSGKVGKIARTALASEYEIVGYDKALIVSNEINDRRNLQKAMRGCQYVVHAAAIPHPTLGTVEDIFHTNMVGTFNVLSAALESQVERLVLISSISYYGIFTQPEWQPSYFPIDEYHPPFSGEPGFLKRKLDIYGQSKLVAEQMAAWFGTNTALKCIALRLARIGSDSSLFQDNGKTDIDFNKDLRQTLWSNIDDDLVGASIKRSIEFSGELDFEAFNIVNKRLAPYFSFEEILDQYYANVPLRKPKKDIFGFFSVEKAEEMLGLSL